MRRWGGHSLGEYAALVGAAAIPFHVALKLVWRRGQLIQDAVPVGQGAMIAVVQVGLDLDYVQRVSEEHDVDVANLNSPNQVVLSGSTEGIATVTALLLPQVEHAGGRIVLLNVSAPFHSKMLRHIEAEFREALEAERHHFVPERARTVTSNFLGGFHDGTADGLVTALTKQISSPVRWIENTQVLTGFLELPVLEIGPNKPLRRFFSDLGFKVKSIIDMRSARRALGPPN